jgi:hypothetical protein
MSSHSTMPPVPPANRSQKGPGDTSEIAKDKAAPQAKVNTAEQGETANIRQNSTNKGYFQGRRVK